MWTRKRRKSRRRSAIIEIQSRLIMFAPLVPNRVYRIGHQHDKILTRICSLYWFESTACPLIAGTFGPIASAFSICALSSSWRVYLPPGKLQDEGTVIDDPHWCVVVLLHNTVMPHSGCVKNSSQKGFIGCLPSTDSLSPRLLSQMDRCSSTWPVVSTSSLRSLSP